MTATPDAVDTPLLHMCGIRKAFGNVEVLRGVDFTLRAGEVHALMGENGAGKSTLIKILAGVHRDHQGSINLRGHEVALGGPRDARARGIAVIHQELALIPHMTVAENICLAREPLGRLGWLNRAAMRATAERTLWERLGVRLDVSRPVADLPIAAQQLVEIAKALSRRAEILVMDEPTSALSETETERLFDAIRQVRDRGAGVIYISHKMDEIYTIADRITVLRDGQHVGTAATSELPPDQLVQWMVGRKVEQFFPKHTAEPGRELLRIESLNLPSADGQRWLVRDASLSIRAGEVVGLAGLMGSGNSELLGAVYGRYGSLPRGHVRIDGRAVERPSPRTAISSGLALLTNDRKASGLVLPMSVLHNLSLAALDRCQRGGWLNRRMEWWRCAPVVDQMRLRAPSLSAPVATLSGGNQQKVVLARWLLTEPKVLMLDEPTRGIDVAAKADIYELLGTLTRAGLGILLVSSDLPELLALSDRVLVMHDGRIVSEMDRDEATPEKVLRAAMGAA